MRNRLLYGCCLSGAADVNADGFADVFDAEAGERALAILRFMGDVLFTKVEECLWQAETGPQRPVEKGPVGPKNSIARLQEALTPPSRNRDASRRGTP